MFPSRLGTLTAWFQTQLWPCSVSAGLGNSAKTRAKPVAVLVTIQPEKARLQHWDTELWDAREDCWAFLGSVKGMHVINVPEGTHKVCVQVVIWGSIYSDPDLTLFLIFEAGLFQWCLPSLAHAPSGWNKECSISFAGFQSHASFQSKNKSQTWYTGFEDKLNCAFHAEMMLHYIFILGTKPALTAHQYN